MIHSYLSSDISGNLRMQSRSIPRKRNDVPVRNACFLR